MLTLATLFWAGNFIVGKAAFVENIPPMSLVFFRWSLVWLILLPFTYKDILQYKEIILKNLPLLFFLALNIFRFCINHLAYRYLLTVVFRD